MKSCRSPNRRGGRAQRERLGVRPKVTVVAVAGGSGSGKTWLARNLQKRLGTRAGILSMDDFYRDLSHLPKKQRDRVDFDDPHSIEWGLFDACLGAIRRSGDVIVPRYSFKSHTRRQRGRKWQPRPFGIVEGLWAWSRRGLERHYALKVFLDGSEQTRLARRMRRDTMERARTRESVASQWTQHVQPNYVRFVSCQKDRADVVLGEDFSEGDVDAIVQEIKARSGRSRSNLRNRSRQNCRPGCT